MISRVVTSGKRRLKDIATRTRLQAATSLLGGNEFEYWRQMSDITHQARLDDPLDQLWLDRGTAQVEFLKSVGLKPNHRFLDYGCAHLATAYHLVPYLEPGNSDTGVPRNHYHVLTASESSLPEITGFQFDFVFSFSVFQYLSSPALTNVLQQIRRSMVLGATFVTSFSRPEHLPELKRKRMNLYDMDRFQAEFPGANLKLKPYAVGPIKAELAILTV